MKQDYLYPWIKCLSKTMWRSWSYFFFLASTYFILCIVGELAGGRSVAVGLVGTYWVKHDGQPLIIFGFLKTHPSGPSLSISRFVRLCVCVSVCVSIHFLSVPFKRPFAPPFQNPMSKMFRDSESLGKSNGKMGFHIWKLLFIKGVKLPRWKKFFSVQLFLYIVSQKTYFPMD